MSTATIDEQVAERGYSTSSEVLRNLLLEGATSPQDGPADEAWLENLRERARVRGGA